MDYVVGSIAALISGNVTPNRPKLVRRALTPTKHPSSPNVTPKSEYVEDRSIFLSPSIQKKKAVVKRSPKRIFETPDLDTTDNNEGSSPKADKVRKHLKDELEAEEMGKFNKVAKLSPGNQQTKPVEAMTPNKKSKINDSELKVINKLNTPKKKRKNSLSEETNVIKSESMDIDETPTGALASEKDSKSTKKMKQRRKSIISHEDKQEEQVSQATEPNQTMRTPEEAANQKLKKKNKKHKKKNKQVSQESKPIENIESAPEITEANSLKKKKRKNKNKKVKSNAQTVKTLETPQAQDDSNDDNAEDQETEDLSKQSESNDEDTSKPALDSDSDDDDQESDSEKEISNIANPNAITEQDTDSEHDSDDEIESENEEINNEVLKTHNAEASSDEDEEPKAKKIKPQKETQVGKESQDKEGNTEEEIKRTLFVGNVPFSNKCKKEIKKIFAQYGDIETVRIRTVPVKDARVTPKLAVIKNEIHPDRSTVNVYVKFVDPDSVERALAENNTVLNQHHLRVTRSGATGLEHDPNLAVFLGNLPFGVEDETLRAKFEKCGDILSVRIVRDKKTNAGKGFGYVNFTSRDGVELALGLSEEDLTIKNRIIRVKRCTQTLNKAKNANKSVKPGPKNQGQNRNVDNQGQNVNNQGQNRNFGNQRNFGNKNQGPSRNFGNNQGPSRNFGNNQGQKRNFGNNQGQNRSFGNQGHNRYFSNNQGQNRNFGNQGQNRNFGNQNKFGNQGNEPTGVTRRLMNKRPHQESSDGPPNKKQNVSQPPREKKQRKEFVGMTAEKKKKQKFDKGMKKKKAISEIMTKKT